MANWKKIILGTSIGAGIVAAVSYVSRLKKTSAELESVSKISIHSVNINGVTIRIDSVLKNPSGTKLKLKYPFVKLIYNNSTVGTSQSINKDITLPAYGEANISGIMVKIPISGIFSAGTGIYKQMLSQQPIAMTVKTISTIDLGWKKLPYENTEQKIINQKNSNQKAAQQKQPVKKSASKNTSQKSSNKNHSNNKKQKNGSNNTSQTTKP